MKKKMERILVIGGFLLAGAGTLLLSRCSLPLPRLPPELAVIMLNETGSLPRGVYMRIPAWFLKEGDYVVYEPPPRAKELAAGRGWLAGDGLLLKKVGALAGGEYGVDPRTMDFRINGRYVGPAFPEDREGRAMPVEYGKRVVPKGMFLPVGASSRSFDGRYTGPVPLGNIKAKAIPLLTEPW